MICEFVLFSEPEHKVKLFLMASSTIPQQELTTFSTTKKPLPKFIIFFTNCVNT
jgi:hypothetical protein